MTKELKPRPNSLQNSTPATEQEIIQILERLAVHYPRQDMDKAKWKLLILSFVDILKGKTFRELYAGMLRYLKNDENKFFPTPGQLLEACKNPFETHHSRHYDRLDPLPPATAPHDAMALIEATRAKYNFGQTDDPELIRRKEEILNRPPLVMTPELIAREKRLAPERKAALERALRFRGV